MIKAIIASLFTSTLIFGIANATIIEDVKEANSENARKFDPIPKIIKIEDEMVFCSLPKTHPCFKTKKKIKVDPAKKYRVSVRLKQNGENKTTVYLGFICYDSKGRVILTQHGDSNTKGSLTSLVATAKKGDKTITVKDASKWKDGTHYYIAFNAKNDMSDIPNREIAGKISKIEKVDELYKISFNSPLTKSYPEGIKVRQHRAGNTYVYTKIGNAPQEWTSWKGKTVTKGSLRKATYISPMIMISAFKEGTGAAFIDFKCEEVEKK